MPDRFLSSGYQHSLELSEKLSRISQTPNVAGVEMPYGAVLRLNNLLEIGRMVSDYDLIISSLAINVTGNKK